VVHVSRGKVLDEVALLAALASGRVGAAALDVFAEEPLPAGHPFWTHPRVLVCPHVSAVSPRFWERELELVLDNWARHRAGRALRNLVDLVAGY
jgi:glyoxylate/hydroxypyruvate reductase A